MTKYIVYTDGGARGNPGRAGAGLAIFDQNRELILKRGVYLGERTNNQAEYLALYLAAKELHNHPKGDVTFYLDSQLVVKQMRGEYKIKDMTLREIAGRIGGLLKERTVEFQHVPRAENKVADSMANVAMDKGKKQGESFTYRA